MKRIGLIVLLSALALALASPAAAQPGWVLSHQKISDTQGDFTGILDDGTILASQSAALGDLDGDGVGDLAVGRAKMTTGASTAARCGCCSSTPTARSSRTRRSAPPQGGFTGILDDGDQLRPLGGLAGRSRRRRRGRPGRGGSTHDDDGGENRGAVWVLFLNTDGTVKSHQKISSTARRLHRHPG